MFSAADHQLVYVKTWNVCKGSFILEYLASRFNAEGHSGKPVLPEWGIRGA